MAKAEAAAAEEGGAPAPAKSKPPIALLIVLVNSLVGMAAVGTLVYTKLLYKHPVITENGEREKLEKARAKPEAPKTRALILFDPVMANIEGNPIKPKPDDGTASQLQGKLHYATVGFSIEIRDEAKKDSVEAIRAKISDLLLSILGHKNVSELTTVQGRYLLRTQLIDSINQMIQPERGTERDTGDGVVTNVYFTQFIVQ